MKVYSWLFLFLGRFFRLFLSLFPLGVLVVHLFFSLCFFFSASPPDVLPVAGSCALRLLSHFIFLSVSIISFSSSRNLLAPMLRLASLLLPPSPLNLSFFSVSNKDITHAFSLAHSPYLSVSPHSLSLTLSLFCLTSLPLVDTSLRLSFFVSFCLFLRRFLAATCTQKRHRRALFLGSLLSLSLFLPSSPLPLSSLPPLSVSSSPLSLSPLAAHAHDG